MLMSHRGDPIGASPKLSASVLTRSILQSPRLSSVISVPQHPYTPLGGGIFVPGLVASVSKATNISYEVMDPFLKISFNKKNLSAEYIEQIRPMSAIAIGLGLRKVGDFDKG